MGRIIALMIVLLTGLISQSFAGNQDADVKGKVVDQQNKPVASASVYLMASTSKVLLKTAVTDENGEYSILKAPKGSYFLQVTSVGFNTANSAVFELGDKTVQIPTIQLTASSQTIEAVTVRGQVPMVQSKDGKLILNVENSTVAAGNNAFEVIKRAPGVSVDKDDNLQLMGQQGVTVTIDGRQTFMTGEQLATFLKSTDGAQIKSVEVSTTRSAKDDAEGAVGTINIVMKKNNLEGFNGTFLASAGMGKHFRGNSSLSLNYKKNNTTVFGSYAYTDNKRQIDLLLDRDIRNGNQVTRFDQDAFLIEREKSHNYKVGMEQKTSLKNTMLLQFTGNNSVEDGENKSLTNIQLTPTSIDSILNSSSISHSPFNRYSTNFNNEYKLDTLGSKLVFDADWSMFKTASDNHYIYRTERPDGTLHYPEQQERSAMPTDIDIYVAKLDWLKQMKKGKFESGVKYSYVKSDNNLQFDSLNRAGNWVDISNRSNLFIYTEQIAAAYLDYSTSIDKWGLKAGLRGEYTISEGNSVTKDKVVNRDYFDLFPSANISYNASPNHIFNLGYAKKVTRPNYRYLNPFRYYIDKLTFQEGNPYIKPQYTHGMTLTYTYRQMFNFTLGMDLTNDAMVESMGQDSITNETWITRDNLAMTSTSYININAPFRIGKIWTMNNNITGIYMHFKGPIAGHYADLGSFFVQGSSMHNFKISPSFSAEMTINGNTPFLYNVYKIQARLNLDAGMNYTFKDQRSSLKLAVTDVFRSSRTKIRTDYNEFQSTISQYNDNQTVRLTYTYKFGNLKQQFRKRDTNSEETNRAN